MSNQLVKKNPAEGYQNVFPKTWIDAIKDKESGVSLQEILQGFNMYFLSYNGSRALTRCKVPSILRKEGLWITYVLYDHTVVTEWYNSDQIDDNSWSMDSNWRVASNFLVGDVSVSADGYWVINGEKTEAKAQGEQGVTPLLRVGANNKLQVSYNAGKAWKDISDYIVPRFKWNQGVGTTAGIIQISMDLGKTWTNLSNEITNNLRISRYIGINESLPTSGVAEGTIYMKGPYYNESDTSNTNPIYRMWVYAWKGNTLAWQDNGEFISISAGVVQEKGTSTTKVMSQDAVTKELTELESKTTEISSTTTQGNDDAIIITDNEDNVVATINKDSCDFKNLKSNGVPVEAIPEILHDETIGEESEQTWESNDGSEVYARINKHGLSAKVFLDVPEFSIPSVVEPDDSIIDSGYSSPIGRANVKRADWSASDKYLYYDFLAHYYDGYINETSSYKVTKRSLGSDASNMGYELFEYDFQPAKYSKVVMLSAGMNTCETGAIWGLATFIKAMMTSNEDGFKFLRENVRFKVLPIICPASFDQATLKYENYNGVAINRNFDYKRSFYDVVWPTKGDYPDSENETRILKKWINDNAWRADLYIDCHQDPDAGEDKYNILSAVICSDSDTTSRISGCMPALVNYYKGKGTIPPSVTPNASAWTEGGKVYPKTKYCKDICGIRALMIEQYCASTMYGSDGTTINDTFQIKQYVAVLRLYIFAALAGNKEVKSLGELGNFIK